VHANHANEIDSTVRRAFDLLAVSGVVLLNQSVLLRGINNTPEALADLSQALFKARVLPYYLHLLDRVHGAAHFEVSEDEATQLLDTVASRLPGYLVPRLVREVAGAAYKQPL
jgi:L-lysine 2,3-aminomutase